MSTETTATETVTGAPVTEATKHAGEVVDEHTPPTPAPHHDTTDATKPDDGLAVIRDSVAALATSVAVLTDTVAGLGARDESPVNRVPWTHRGGPVHHDAGE